MQIKKIYFKWNNSLEINGLKTNQSIIHSELIKANFTIESNKDESIIYNYPERKYFTIKVKNNKIIRIIISDKFLIKTKNIINEFWTKEISALITSKLGQSIEEPKNNYLTVILMDGIIKFIVIKA